MVAKKSARKTGTRKKAAVAKAATKKATAKKSPARKKTAAKKKAPARKKAAARKAAVKKVPDAKKTTAAPKKKATGVSSMSVNLGHVFALRPRVSKTFRQNDFLTAKHLLQDEKYANVAEAARAVVEKALELTHGTAFSLTLSSRRNRSSS